MKECTFEGCEKTQAGQGLCSSHYSQKRRGLELRPIRPYRRMTEDGLKPCSKCEVAKPWSAYFESASSVCKVCQNKARTEARHAKRAGMEALWAALEAGEIELTEDAKRIVEAVR